jgi:hypothetical protein
MGHGLLWHGALLRRRAAGTSSSTHYSSRNARNARNAEGVPCRRAAMHNCPKLTYYCTGTEYCMTVPRPRAQDPSAVSAHGQAACPCSVWLGLGVGSQPPVQYPCSILVQVLTVGSRRDSDPDSIDTPAPRCSELQSDFLFSRRVCDQSMTWHPPEPPDGPHAGLVDKTDRCSLLLAHSRVEGPR